MPITGYSSGCLGSVSPYDTAVNSWISAVITAGGTVSNARATIVNSLVLGLKADGIFDIIDIMFLFAAENQQQALIDLISPHSAGLSGNPVWTVNQGYLSTSSPVSFVNLAYGPSADGIAYTQDSAHLCLYARSLDGGGGNNYLMGANDFDFAFIATAATVTQFLYQVNDQTETIISATPQTGDFIASRTSPTTKALYNRGALVQSNSVASTGTMGQSLFAGAEHNSNEIPNPGDVQVAVVTAGGGLNATQAAALSARINAYMTAIGSNVF